MGDTISIDTGAKVAWDVLKIDGVPGRQTSPGAEVSVGADFSLNPRDDIRAMIVAGGTGLLHDSEAGRFFGLVPELGFGVGGKRYFARLMGGPLWTNNTDHLNATARFDFGIHLGERAALTLGARYMFFPKVGLLTKSHTEVDVIDYATGDFRIVDRQTSSDQDASIMRYLMGLEISLF